MTSAGPVLAETYYLDGKPISQNYYQAAKLLNESVPLLQSNRNQEALEKLTTASQLAPEIPEVHNNMGLVLAKLGRNAEALQELEKAKAMKPDLAATWVTLGGLYQSQGRIQDAIATYSEFLKRFPSHSEANKIQSLVNGLKREVNSGFIRKVDPNATDYLGELGNSVKRWPPEKMPIKIYFKSGHGVPAFKPIYQQILEESVATWEQASQGAISFQRVDSPQKADIVCSWTNDPSTFSNRAEAGETILYANQKGVVKGTVTILTVPLMVELPVTEARLRQICLHEIGHALGFGGHTSNPDDVMFYSLQVSDQIKNLSARDINSLRQLYK